jgi:replicative DNA helicase
VPTGFGSLDYYTDGGIDRGSFVIYSGETSIGKTAAAIQTQLAALEKGLTVVVIGLEMRGVEYVKRMLSLNARQKGYRDMSLLNFSKPTKRGYNYEMYRRTWDEDWQGYNNKYLKMKSIDFNEMKKLFMSASTRFKADVIILDHMQSTTSFALVCPK